MLMLLAVLASEPMPTVTLGEVEALPPEQAGELVLAGREHEPIVSVTRIGGMLPPGITELELIERARPVPGGCVRRSWTAVFNDPAAGQEAARPLSTLRGKEQVALPSGRGCPASGYTGRDAATSRERALELLRVLDRALARGSAPTFECRDETGGDLCASPAKIRTALAALRPWGVGERLGTAEYWLGIPGQVITKVRFRPDQPGQVSVLRLIPPPF